MVGAATDMVYRVSAGGLLLTLGLYAGIFLLILISSLVRVGRSTAVQLMRSQAEGEKPPRANWALAVLIIYYKQISEGYEDQARFDIMQKVGMTRRDIRSSINSQLLLVFFLPLLLAGLHLAFAFPFVHKLLLLFNLWNTRLLVGTTAASFLAFAALYTLVYRITSNAYYHIVSGGGER